MSESEVRIHTVEYAGIKRIPAVVGYGLVNLCETLRAKAVNPRSNPSSWASPEVLSQAPLLNPDTHPLLYQTLSYAGDFYDGYWLAFAAHTGISLFDFV